MKVVIKNDLKSGDSLTIAANAATDRIGGITVAIQNSGYKTQGR